VKYVLQIVAVVGKVTLPTTELMVGQYIRDLDLEYANGRGLGKGTRRLRDAKMFDTQEEALAYWGQQSKVRPLRPDGKPNRPLTVFTCSVIPVMPVETVEGP
jgi:hypothetical protein